MAKNEESNTVQAFWLAIGSLSSFGFAMVSSMILSRYLPKEDYGTYRQIIYIYSTLLMVFTLGLPKAYSYFLPRVELDEAKDVVHKINRVFFFIGIIFSLILFSFSSTIATILRNDDLTLALKIFSPVPLFILPTMGIESILAVYRKTQISAIYTVITRILMLSFVALPVVIFKGNYIHAIIGMVVSSILSFLIGFYLKNLPFKLVTKIKTKISYKQIFRFSLPLMYASFWGIIISSSDQFFISRFFGQKVFAEFANGSLELPFVGMIIGAASTVLMPVFSKKIHDKVSPEKEILPIWRSVFAKTAKLTYPLILFFWFFADIIMTVLYGSLYENSSTFFRIKLLVNFFTLIAYGPLILAIGATRYYANVHLVGAIALVSLEYLALLLFESAEVIIIVSVICQIGRILAMIMYITRYFKLSIVDLFPFGLLAKILILSFSILLLIRYFMDSYFDMQNITKLVLSFISFFITYAIGSFLLKIDYISIIQPLITKFKRNNK